MVGINDITAGVMALSDTVATRLRRSGLKCGTVQVVILDPQFKAISRQQKLARPTHLLLEIKDAAIDIIKSAWNMKAPIRMLTITGMNLVAENESEQISFFGEEEDKKREKIEKIEKTVDSIRSRYGKGSISFGSNTNSDIGISDTKDGSDQ